MTPLAMIFSRAPLATGRVKTADVRQPAQKRAV
jgi:hypothetical protein